MRCRISFSQKLRYLAINIAGFFCQMMQRA